MNIIGKTYLTTVDKTMVTVQIKERKSSTVLLMSHTYEVSLLGDFQLGSEALEDAVAVELEAAGVNLSQILG